MCTRIQGSFGASADAQYLGMISIQREELSDLMDNDYAQLRTFDWEQDPQKEGRIQRMVRGNVTLRGGLVGARLQEERVFVIYAAKNLGRANTGALLGLGSSDPFVEVSFNGVVVGKTPTIEGNLNPVGRRLGLLLVSLYLYISTSLYLYISISQSMLSEALDSSSVLLSPTHTSLFHWYRA